MHKKELTELSDEELLAEARKMKSASIKYALLIGFLVGIVIYSAVKNTIGFFTLIPLYFIYKLVKNSSYEKKALEALLKERKLK